MVPVIAPNTISEYLRLFSKSKQRCIYKDDAILINSFGIQIEFFSRINRNMISDTKHGFLNNANIIGTMIIKHTYTLLHQTLLFIFSLVLASGNSFQYHCLPFLHKIHI